MGCTTYVGRARRALMTKQNSTFWVAVARTTIWPNEQSPPSPSPGVTSIDEPICFVKADNVRLCKLVNSGGDINHLGQAYQFVDDTNAISEMARFLYLHAEFHPAQGQPYGSFRQIAVFSGLVPKAGYESDLWLAPTNVQNPGVLEYLDNDVVTVMSLTKYEVVPIIIEFR